MPLSDNVDLKSIAYSEMADGFSGADLNTVVKEAGLMAILNN